MNHTLDRLRSFYYPALAALVVAVLAGCSPPLQVYSRWGPGVRFSETTSTFDWALKGRHVSGEGRPRNPDVDPLIREMVERHLSAKGYTKVSGTIPDFWIDYRVGRNVRGDPYGTAQLSDFTEGALALYVVNPADERLIWRGSVKARIDESLPPEKMKKFLDQAIKAMLDQLPSRKSGR